MMTGVRVAMGPEGCQPVYVSQIYRYCHHGKSKKVVSTDMGRRAIAKWIEDQSAEVLLADGFEGAFIGMCERFGMEPVAAYDRGKCLNILIQRDQMTYEEAEEFFDFNVIGAWAGDLTPVFVTLKT